MNDRMVTLTLRLTSESDEDAVRQFISAVGIYGLGGFDFAVYEPGEVDDVREVNGREAMILTMPELDERRREREDDILAEVRSDLLNAPDEEGEDESPA